jgi:hypothetical protein
MPILDSKHEVIAPDGETFYIDSPTITANGDRIEFSMQINTDGEWHQFVTTIPTRSSSCLGTVFVKEGKLFLEHGKEETELKNGEMERILLERAALDLLKK